MKYNGWANFETWNVALWLGNDEGLYHLARRAKSYTQLIALLQDMGSYKTGDGVRWDSAKVSRREITAMIKEL